LDPFIYLTIGTGISGGVMEQAQLFPMIRKKVYERLNSYLAAKEILAEIDSFIVPPKLGNRAGMLGAIALAERLLKDIE
jgi:fructokinase